MAKSLIAVQNAAEMKMDQSKAKLQSTGHTEGVFMDSDVGWVRDTTPTQYATVLLSFEDGCDPAKGECERYVTGLMGVWSELDLELLWESVDNNFDLSTAPKEGCVTLFLQEDGEWDGFPHWQKYFTIKNMIVHN